MLTHGSIIDCSNYVADYINMHVSSVPEELRGQMLVAAREVSPVVRIVKGMEALYAVVRSDYNEDQPTALNALYSCASQVAEGGFWGKGERAVSLMKYARHAAGEWPEGLDAPAAPEVDPEYTATPPAPPAG